MRRKKLLVLVLAGLVSIFLSACDLPFLSSEGKGNTLEAIKETIQTGKPKKTVSSLKLQEYQGDMQDIPLTGYAYDCLKEGQQAWYEEIFYILRAMETEVELDDTWIEKGYDETDMDKAFQAVMIDHPELFYVVGYSYSAGTVLQELKSMSFNGSYSITEEEMDQRKKEIADRESIFFSGIEEDDSTYEKLLAIYRNVIFNTEYDLSAPDNQNIYSCLVGGRSVCNGYAKSFQYLCLKLDIPCSIVTGNDNTGEPHVWNLVQAEGEYYLVDATWGDASYIGDNVDGFPDISYDYFMVTSEELLKTHIEDNVVPVPRCIATALNYYVQEDLYFDVFDENKLNQVFTEADYLERDTISIKAGNQETYEELFGYLVEDSQIFSLWSHNSIHYNDNEELRTLTFWVAN